VKALQYYRILLLAGCFVCLPVMASAVAPVAVFPLQELREGRNDANLPFTRILADGLADNGNKIISLETVIKFMANNRIRTLGNLETFRISQVRNELGAAFVLFGTVCQQREKPEPSLGLTLKLVRTSDFRTIWSYVGSASTGEERRVLAIGEPQSVAELQPLLLDEISEQWPWQRINEVQQVGSLNIDSVVLEPRQVRPGDEVTCRVRLRENWSAGQTVRVFFKADDQLYPAILTADGNFEGTWVAGEKNGRYPVHLLLEWPLYGRTESALLGSYLIDGIPPLLELDLAGAALLDGMPVFYRKLAIIPRLLVRKPMSRWRLAFYYDGGNLAGAMDGSGNLPKKFVWSGAGFGGTLEDGVYLVEVEAWDKAGNSAKASRKVEINRSMPQVELAVEKSDEGMTVDLEHEGKVPLSFWRMEMWTKEGKLLTHAEGDELPIKIGIKLPDAEQDQEVQGFIFTEDILGRQVRRKVENLLPKLEPGAEEKAKDAEEKAKGISESWVDEF